MLRGPRDVGNGLDRHAIVVSLKGRTQNRQLLMRLQSSEAFVGLDHAGRDPSQGHTGIPPAFDVARDAAKVPIMFSAMFVQASDRRSSFGSFNRTTVRISSRPSRMLAATPGHCASLVACLISFSRVGLMTRVSGSFTST
jgi:hypothetical protein